MPGKCLYLFCSNADNGEKTLFRCPKNRERSEKWLKAAGREDILQKKINNYKLCEDHFERKYIFTTWYGNKRLYNDAVPTIFCRSYQVNSDGISIETRKENSSSASVELFPEIPSSASENQPLTSPPSKKRKGLLAYRINKFKTVNNESTEASIAASEPSTSASISTRPSNELESVYCKEEPSERVQEEDFQPQLKIERDDFYADDDIFVEPPLYTEEATSALEGATKLDIQDFVADIVESTSDLVTLFRELSEMAKRMDPLAQAMFQNKVSNAVFQLKIKQLSRQN